MKLRSLFAAVMASAMAFVACENGKVDLGTPSIALSQEEVTLEAAGGNATVEVTATRDWKVTVDETAADWLVVDPASGTASADAQQVTVSALSNDGYDREVSLAFSIGMQTKYLTVKQAGPKGSADALVVYGNNFDKTKAEKGDRWSTYLDTFDGWRNETGVGIASVTYASKSLTARTNSGNGSAGKYSDYIDLGASGMNYLWFGTAPTYFAVKNITLPEGQVDYTLSFGTERYEYAEGKTVDNTFKWDEFSVYVSADAKKWVKLSCDFAGGSLPNGRWDLASSTFTLPAGTTSLSLYFTSTYGAAYAIDDLNLVQAETAGTTIDFATGVEIEVVDNITDNSGDNSEVTPPTPPAGAIFFESFASGKGDFTIEDKILPEGLTYVWNEDTQYKNMKASAFKDEVKYATESWLISPEVDLTSVTAAYLLFEHTGKHFGTMADEATVYARKAGGEWAKLTIPTYMSGNDWTFVSSGAIDLKDYIGGKMQFAFKYVSTSNAAGTWEIKNVCVSPTAESTGGNTGGGNTDGGGNGGELDPDAAWSYLFAKDDLGDSYSAPVTKTLNGAEWSFAMTGSTYLGWDSNNGRGLQMGKSKEPASEVTLSTSGISGNIKKIVVNTAGASGTDAELVVKVGETALGSPVKTTTTATDYTFEAETAVSGAVELKWTLTKAAVYIKSISVYTE